MAGRFNNKWTAEEEAAIRNGITKHGVGKWRIILNDPEFSASLRNRTNVSLKDKWRTMKGYKPVPKIIKKPSRYYTKSVAFTSEGSNKDKIAQPDAPAIIYESSEDESFDELISRFHEFKLDDLTNAKELSSSTLKQEQLRPPKKRFLYGNTNSITANEKFNEELKEPEYDSAESDRRAKAAVDAEVWRITVMTPEDAAAAAAAAVNMAEAAITAAEEAEREAVEAERLAEEKKFIAEELARKLEEKKTRAATKQEKQGGGRNC